jgi:hypothetical protein
MKIYVLRHFGILQLCTSSSIRYILFILFSFQYLQTNLLKFELGISNYIASSLYLPLVSGDNNFICCLSARQMPWQ